MIAVLYLIQDKINILQLMYKGPDDAFFLLESVFGLDVQSCW